MVIWRQDLRRGDVALWIHMALSLAITISGAVLLWLEVLEHLSGGQMNHSRAAFWLITSSFGAGLLVHKYYGREFPLWLAPENRTQRKNERDLAFIAIGLFLTLSCFGSTIILWHKDYVLDEKPDVRMVATAAALGLTGLILLAVGTFFSKKPTLFPVDDCAGIRDTRQRYSRIGMWMRVAAPLAAIALISSAIIVYDAEDSIFGVMVSIGIGLWIGLSVIGGILGGKPPQFSSATIRSLRLHPSEKRP
jgi:hypothetical protein